MFSSNELLFNGRKKGERNIKGCREEGKSRHRATWRVSSEPETQVISIFLPEGVVSEMKFSPRKQGEKQRPNDNIILVEGRKKTYQVFTLVLCPSSFYLCADKMRESLLPVNDDGNGETFNSVKLRWKKSEGEN
jgi:hypothetical protein